MRLLQEKNSTEDFLVSFMKKIFVSLVIVGQPRYSDFPFLPL